MVLSPKDLGVLQEIIGPLTQWMQHQQPTEAANSLSSVVENPASQAMHRALHRVYDLIKPDKKNGGSGNYTVNDLKVIFHLYDNQVWSQALLTIFMNSKPAILPEFFVKGIEPLADKISVANSKSKVDKALIENVNDTLGRLSWTGFMHLGEVCALVRDTSGKKIKDDASSLGYPILAGNHYDFISSDKAGQIFLFLSQNCEELLGVGKPQTCSTLGMRDNYVKIDEGSIDHFEDEKNILREYYSKVFPPHQQIVDDLFRLYELKDIARGIYEEFGSLPEGWMEILYENPEVQSWFDVQIPVINKSSPVNTGHRLKEFTSSGDRSDLFRVVDEIVDGERRFYHTLKDFDAYFVKPLLKEAEKYQSNPDACARNLGLAYSDIKKIFGVRFARVLALSRDMVVQYEVLRLIRSETKTEGGRIGAAAQIVLRNQGKFMEVYSPYNKGVEYATKTVKAAMDRVQESALLMGRTGFFDDLLKQTSFIDIYEEAKKQSNIISTLTIESVLIKPVQRFPFLKLLFGRANELAQKTIDPKDPVHGEIEKAIALCQKVNELLNGRLQEKMRLKKMLGEDID